MVLNKIDTYEFLSLGGPPDLVKQMILPIDRPGVDGTEFWLTGSRSRPSPWISQVDCNDLEHAWDQVKLYTAMIDGTPRNVTLCDVDLAAKLGLQFMVLDVQPIPPTPHRLLSCTGGLSTQKGAFLVCQWILQAIPST
ncbi:MAG: hypothetical protein AB7O62_00415 [Pirellulales bacterium]